MCPFFITVKTVIFTINRPTCAILNRMAQAFPFSAIVGQDEMKTAILIAAIDPSIGGVLVLGDRGTGKSTAVRALAALLPRIKAVTGCRYGCDPADGASRCADCAALRPR
jgi:magnesium chelatase subunit I